MKKKLIEILTVILFFFLLTNYAKTEDKIIIKFQIENEILTNVDFLNEEKYLLALNNSLQNIPKNQLKQLSKDSLIREKIKKIELSKYFDFNKESKYGDQLLADFYKRLNFNNEKQFKLYLKKYNLNLIDIKEKLKVESLWNELIYKKFNNQVSVNEERLKKKLLLQKNLMTEYDLSEILFEIKDKEKLDTKYKLILQNINDSGFKNAANIFSISNSSKFGGDLGWINETQLNENLLNQIKPLNIKQLTKPIQVTNGYLIIKLNDKREKKLKIDFDKTLKKMILEEKNRQLNQFSLIYFNKIKQNTFVSEK
jgi:peptidyl-prolyl cis-trans isomerase SurA